MKLVKLTDEHYVIVDENAEIKEGDWIYNAERKPSILKCVGKGSLRGWQKITHSTNILTNGMGILYLSEVKELIGEVDVEKKAEYYYDMMYFMAKDDNIKLYVVRDYVTAYNQALEDNKEKKYTEEDVRVAIRLATTSKYDHRLEFYSEQDILQSLQQPTQWDVKFDSQGKLKLV